MSTNYSAAIDTSDIVLSYGEESVWGTLPAVQFDAVRLTGESLSESKQRARPNEIKPDGVVSHAITTQVGVEGAFNFALSAGTFDDFVAATLNSTFSAPETITQTDFVAAAAGGTITTTAGDFSGLVADQWVSVTGFAEAGNNGYFKVVSATSTVLTVTPNTLVDETPGTSCTVKGSTLVNGTTVRTFFMQKELASNLFLTYAGVYPSSMQLNASVGGFAEGSFNVMAKNEAKATTDSSTGAANAAPSGRVIDTVSGVATLLVNGAALSAPAQSVQLNITKQGARSQYAIGSADAQGIGRGTIDVSGSISLYFADFTNYDLYKNETDVEINIGLRDNTGNGYVFTLPAATLMNPSIVAGGPDSDVMAEFQLEGNPDANGVICQVDTFS